MATPAPTSESTPESQPNSIAQRTHLSPSEASARTRRQRGLFFGGAVFVVFSAIITRRSLARRYKAIGAASPPISHSSKPPLSKGAPSSAQATGYKAAVQAARSKNGGAGTAQATAEDAEAEALKSSGPILAVEALTVATMNVVSWALMATGGLLWYFDIGNMEDLRRMVRGGFGGVSEQEAEEEMEEWLASVLARKEEKERRKGAGQEVSGG